MTARNESALEVEFFLDARAFDAFRDDPAFHRILTLARIVNTIRFAEVAVVTRDEDGTPSATRQSSSALFYLSSLLWEAFRFAERLGEPFREYASFRSTVVPLLKDPAVQALRTGVLHRLRNQAVYHHDDDVIPSALAVMGGDEFVLMSARGPTRREGYYDLADIAVMQFALGTPRTPQEFVQQANATLMAITHLGVRFAAAADEVIREYVMATGWNRRVNPVESEDGAEV